MTERNEEGSSTTWNGKHIIATGGVLGCVGLAFILNNFAPGPGSENALKRGSSAYQERKYQEASDAFTRAIALNPGNSVGYFGRALALHQLGKADAAKADYDTVVHLKPDFAEAYYNRGLIFTDLGKPDEALADFADDARLRPQDADPHLRRVDIFRALGDFDHALAERNILLDLRQRRPEDYLALSALKRDFGDLEGAIGTLDTAIGSGAGFYDAFLNRGLLRRDKGDTAGALDDLTKAIALKSNPTEAGDTRAYVARGETLLVAGRTDAAKAEFDDTIKRNSDSSPADASRGMLALFVLGDAAAAATDLDAAVDRSFQNRDFSDIVNLGIQEALKENRPSEQGPQAAPYVPFVPAIYYYVAWRHLAHQVAGQDDGEAFAAEIRNLGDCRFALLQCPTAASWTEAFLIPPAPALTRPSWPAPVLALLAGAITSDVVLRAAAAEPAPALRHQQLCEADLFLAEYGLTKKASQADTQKLFSSAVDECPPNTREAVFAKAALQRVSAPPK